MSKSRIRKDNTVGTTRQPVAENILGYKIESLIGEGGFGAVWRATAPGGLSKAIKIVFGYHDQTRAQSELKALNKVKEIRHPFLLSLERIEIVDGQLVVVTELAEGSLSERFREVVTQGMNGIPRDELLGYIRDAADGLDYLCNKHLLQHLDVKPENLLLVAGHVKVADYGLVKDVRSNNHSVMSGLTPNYAAPELFDGCPSQLSDQYSLAIVYQEMLTGIRPFAGETPAQLARQHMLGRPNLEPLPRGDQAVVARALSKDPALRFDSCIEFYDELARRRASVPKKRARQTDVGIARKVDSTANRTQIVSATQLPTSYSSQQAVRLAPLACDGDQAAFHPTLLIGIGRMGSLAIQGVKERLYQRFGRADELPALKMLCIDTDIHDLANVTNANERCRFRDEEVLPVPLKTSSEYRQTGAQYSAWLSRRWVFNIPRSFSTEGIRPLGRLAFADHVDTILDRLHTAIQGLDDPQALEESANKLSLPADKRPRIFIVGSVSGGVGSGMIADLAYAVRTVMQENGLNDEHLIGLFSHGAHTSEGAPLATANTYTFLREISHYAKLGYPGDASIHLPAFDDEDSPAFTDVYLQHMANETPEAQAKMVTDYLYLDVMTSCSDFFKRCRQGRDEDGVVRLRSFGFSNFEMHQEYNRARFSNFLRDRLIGQWMDASTFSNDALDIPQFVARAMKSADISLENVIQIGRTRCDQSHGNALENTLAEIARAFLTGNSGDVDLDAVLKALDQYLSDANAQAHNEQSPNEQLILFVEQTTPPIWQSVSDLIDIPTICLAGARKTHTAILQHFDDLRQSLSVQLDQLRRVMGEVQVSEEISQEEAIARLIQLRCEVERLKWAFELVTLYRESDRSLQEQFQDVGDLLDSTRSLSKEELPSCDTASLDRGSFAKMISVFLNSHVAIFVKKLESQVHKVFFQGMGGLRAIASNHVNNAAHLANAITIESRRLVAASFSGLNFDVVLDTAVPDQKLLANRVKQQLTAASPRLMESGGTIRLLLAVPPATSGRRLADVAESLFSTPTVIHGSHGEVAFCFEGEDVSLENLALRLLEENPEATEYIERIASRLDVEWSPLTGLG